MKKLAIVLAAILVINKRKTSDLVWSPGSDVQNNKG